MAMKGEGEGNGVNWASEILKCDNNLICVRNIVLVKKSNPHNVDNKTNIILYSTPSNLFHFSAGSLTKFYSNIQSCRDLQFNHFSLCLSQFFSSLQIYKHKAESNVCYEPTLARRQLNWDGRLFVFLSFQNLTASVRCSSLPINK